MINRPKQKGTEFETAVKNWLNENTTGTDFERFALHGKNDIGDLVSKKLKMIIECKAYRKYSPCHIKRWVEETRREIENASEYFGEKYSGVLVIKNNWFGVDKSFKVLVLLDTPFVCFLDEGYYAYPRTAREKQSFDNFMSKFNKIDWSEKQNAKNN